MSPINRNLSDSVVHVAGTGRIGSEVILALATAGLRYTSGNDPQRCGREQLSHWIFARPSDLGRPKVQVLERELDGRPDFVFEPVFAPNQSAEVEPYLEKAHLIVSCANRMDARFYVSDAAFRLDKVCMQVCAQDGRRALGGLISIWAPGSNGACFGCLFPTRQRRTSGELLLPTVTRTLANLAALLAETILTRSGLGTTSLPNAVVVDLAVPSIERLMIAPRPGCSICGSSKARR